MDRRSTIPIGAHFRCSSKRVAQITGTGNYFAVQPHWSLDGTRIIFCMFIDGGEGIHTANRDGSDVKQATFTTNSAASFNGPDWGVHSVAP